MAKKFVSYSYRVKLGNNYYDGFGNFETNAELASQKDVKDMEEMLTMEICRKMGSLHAMINILSWQDFES